MRPGNTVNWRKDTRLTKLALSQIDLDDTMYLAPSYEDLGLLKESIQRIGIVNPPMAQERPGMPAIPVLGRRRLLAANSLGFDAAEVVVVDERVSTQELYAAVFWDNVERVGVNPATKAYVCRRLLELFQVEEVARDFLPALGVSPTGPRLDRLRSVGGLDERTLDALGHGAIDERTAGLLTDLGSSEREALLDLGETLRLNANKTRELVSTLADLSVFQATSVRELLDDPSIESVLKDPDTPTPEKAETIRKIVRGLRFPEIVGKEREFEKQFGFLTRDSKIVVSPTPGFEDERCVIRVPCDSWDDAEEALRNLAAKRPKSD